MLNTPAVQTPAAAAAMLQDRLAPLAQAVARMPAQVIQGPQLLAAMCDMQAFSFTLEGEPVSSRSVLSDELLYPVVAEVARRCALESARADLGFKFEADPQHLLGVRVSGPPITAHPADLFRGLFLLDACTTVFQVQPNRVVEIAALVHQLREHFFADFLAQQQLPAPSTAAPLPA